MLKHCVSGLFIRNHSGCRISTICTTGQAAEIAGYSKRTFMELLPDYNVSFFNDDTDGLNHDIVFGKEKK
jgi:predicted HTH domain antitoxin